MLYMDAPVGPSDVPWRTSCARAMEQRFRAPFARLELLHDCIVGASLVEGLWPDHRTSHWIINSIAHVLSTLNDTSLVKQGILTDLHPPESIAAYWDKFENSRVLVGPFSHWHLTTQQRLFEHLRTLWAEKRPRVMVDLGCHAGHGSWYNTSDALLWLDAFGADGGKVLGVDAFEVSKCPPG